MQKDAKKPGCLRIDLSNCKLLSPYGRNAAEGVGVNTKVGQVVKIGLLNKTGRIIKPGALS